MQALASAVAPNGHPLLPHHLCQSQHTCQIKHLAISLAPNLACLPHIHLNRITQACGLDQGKALESMLVSSRSGRLTACSTGGSVEPGALAGRSHSRGLSRFWGGLPPQRGFASWCCCRAGLCLGAPARAEGSRPQTRLQL